MHQPVCVIDDADVVDDRAAAHVSAEPVVDVPADHELRFHATDCGEQFAAAEAKVSVAVRRLV
jgi:hypothetical protein